METIPIPEPTGKFIIENAKGIAGLDGQYYHYAEVCSLLKKYKKFLNEATVEQSEICPCCGAVNSITHGIHDVCQSCDEVI